MDNLPEFGDSKVIDGIAVHTSFPDLKVETHENGYKITFPDGAVKYHPLLTRAKKPVNYLVMVKRTHSRSTFHKTRLDQPYWEIGSSASSFDNALNYARAKCRDYGAYTAGTDAWVISVAGLKPTDYSQILDVLEDTKQRLLALGSPVEIMGEFEKAIDAAGKGLVMGDGK